MDELEETMNYLFLSRKSAKEFSRRSERRIWNKRSGESESCKLREFGRIAEIARLQVQLWSAIRAGFDGPGNSVIIHLGTSTVEALRREIQLRIAARTRYLLITVARSCNLHDASVLRDLFSGWRLCERDEDRFDGSIQL